jgi:hypothetical protein
MCVVHSPLNVGSADGLTVQYLLGELYCTLVLASAKLIARLNLACM